jgi:hypothetical protein
MIARLSMRYAMAVVIALGFVAVTRPAISQTPAPATAPAAAPSPAAMLLAKQIVELKGVKDMFEPVARGVIEKAKDGFLQNNFMWQKDIDEIALNMHKDYDARSAELVDTTARIYASHFTEPELKTILTFYQSPLGKKMVAQEPKAMDESMASAAQWADNLSNDIVNKMRAEMKKRGHDM